MFVGNQYRIMEYPKLAGIKILTLQIFSISLVEIFWNEQIKV